MIVKPKFGCRIYNEQKQTSRNVPFQPKPSRKHNILIGCCSKERVLQLKVQKPMHLSRWALQSYKPTLSSSLSVKDVPLSMFSSESLCILQTVSLHLDGHNVVTWDHGQTQNSGLSLGESVCNQRTINNLLCEICSAIQWPIKRRLVCIHLHQSAIYIL